MPRITQASTKARRKRDDQSRRLAVLDAAEGAFVEEGYQGTTTDRIALRAEVSVGTVYNLYASKERLYAAVAERVGEEMVAHMEQTVLPVADPGGALDLLVRFRLSGFDRHRLLLVLFSAERVAGSSPPPESMPEARRLYDAYLDRVASLFAAGMKRGRFASLDPLHLALSFEGMVSAFVGYWLGRERGRCGEEHSRRFTETFLAFASARPAPADAAPAETMDRQIFVTSFDASRLRELITVARAFGDSENAGHLDELEASLASSRMVEPDAVPRDVVTMNSRVRLRPLGDGDPWTCSLVFPADAHDGRESVSVLTPLGTALLGRRVGAAVEAAGDGTRLHCEVAELLYQPEAAGDFHR